jgi:hypothetical protein
VDDFAVRGTILFGDVRHSRQRILHEAMAGAAECMSAHDYQTPGLVLHQLCHDRMHADLASQDLGRKYWAVVGLRINGFEQRNERQ